MLFDKYAPSTWTEYVGQDRAVSLVRRIIDRPGFDRGAFWIDCAGDNNSGTGKTSLARLIASTLADPMNVQEVPGANVDKAWCREMAESCQYCTMGTRPFRVFIVNESHAISPGAVDFLLAFMDRMPRNVVLVFTTTRKPESGLFGTDEGPFYSRCVRVTLTNQGLAKAFGARLATIARAEGLDGGRPDEWFLKLVQRTKNNMRAALQLVWSGAALSDQDTESAAA